MIVNIESWLNKNKVAYTANRNKKNGNQIDRNRFNIELLEQKEGLMIMAS